MHAWLMMMYCFGGVTQAHLTRRKRVRVTTQTQFTNAKPPAESRHIDERGIVRNANGDPIHGGSTATLVVMVKDANGAGANLITAVRDYGS
jgi:hypothetical protein